MSERLESRHAFIPRWQSSMLPKFHECSGIASKPLRSNYWRTEYLVFYSMYAFTTIHGPALSLPANHSSSQKQPHHPVFPTRHSLTAEPTQEFRRPPKLKICNSLDLESTNNRSTIVHHCDRCSSRWLLESTLFSIAVIFASALAFESRQNPRCTAPMRPADSLTRNFV